jgi:hypothetical protein
MSSRRGSNLVTFVEEALVRAVMCCKVCLGACGRGIEDMELESKEESKKKSHIKVSRLRQPSGEQ